LVAEAVEVVGEAGLLEVAAHKGARGVPGASVINQL
jgi:hypothetical protein